MGGEGGIDEENLHGVRIERVIEIRERKFSISLVTESPA